MHREVYMVLMEVFEDYREAEEWAAACCDDGTYDIHEQYEEDGTYIGIGVYKLDEYCWYTHKMSI